jgi:hypothetical protein
VTVIEADSDVTQISTDATYEELKVARDAILVAVSPSRGSGFREEFKALAYDPILEP